MKIVEIEGKKYNVVYEKPSNNIEAIQHRYCQADYKVATAPNNVVVLLDEMIDAIFKDVVDE